MAIIMMLPELCAASLFDHGQRLKTLAMPSVSICRSLTKVDNYQE